MCRDYIRNQEENSVGRYVDTKSIYIEHGYSIEAFAEGVDAPSSILFTEDGEMLIASSGYVSGNPVVSKLNNGRFEIIANDFHTPLTGITHWNGDLFVSHKGVITVIEQNGRRNDLIRGLPSHGDHSNSRVAIGPDMKIYFGQGTATNSGVVGPDNYWVYDNPLVHDMPSYYTLLNGQNFRTNNMMLSAIEDTYTGAFAPYGHMNQPFEKRKGILKASGSILKADMDGRRLEVVASGLRNPAYIKFSNENNLFVSNNGYDIRGSRPVANAPDEFLFIHSGAWYGWPDFAGGVPITSERFRPDGGSSAEFLLSCHPELPQKPFTSFAPDSSIAGFDFNKDSNFGTVGDVYIAEMGKMTPRNYGVSTLQYPSVGHKISKIDIRTGGASTFAMNTSGFPTGITGEGGFDHPGDVAFGPDGALYVADIGISPRDNRNIILPNTGVIWKITRNVQVSFNSCGYDRM